MRSHKKTGIQVAVLARMSSQTSAGDDVADSPAEAPPAVSEILSEEVEAQEAPNVCETSDSSSSESSSESDADEEDETKITEPVVIADKIVAENPSESITEGEEPKALEAVEEETDIFKADGEDSKDSKSDEEDRSLVASPRADADTPQRSTVVATACPEDAPSKIISPNCGKTKKRKSFNMVIQENKSKDEVKLSKEKGTQRGQPKGHLDKKSSTELQQAKKKKTMCASATHESASSHEPDPKKNHPKEQTAGEVIKKSHKRKKPVSPTKDVSVTRVAEDVKCDDSGNTTGITDLKETNIGNVCVSSKKSSKASRNKKVKVENTTKVTRARSAYIFFVMEERIRVKEENNLDNKDVMKKIAEEWNALSTEGKKKYEDMAEADKKRSADEREHNPEKGNKISEPTASSKKEKEEFKSKARRESRPLRSAKSLVSANFEDVDDDQESKEAGISSSRADFKCEDDTAWITAEELEATGDLEKFVVAKSLNGEYITKRKGMDYTQVDYEEGQQEKNTKSSQEDDGMSRDLTEAICRYEFRLSAFKKELKSRTADGKLDLDDLRSGSPLEMLAFLGNMREDVFLPSSTRLPPPDVWMKVPMLGLCHLMQTLLDGERAGKATLIKRLAACQQRLQNLQAKHASQD